MTQAAGTRVEQDAAALWARWVETTFGPWSTALRDGGAQLDPFGLYRQWLDELSGGASRASDKAVGAPGPQALAAHLAGTANETWRQAGEVSAALARLAPRWVELVEAVAKSMVEGGLPTDPLDLTVRWYNATSGPLSAAIRDLLSDEAYLTSTRRLLENYATLDTVFRRACQEFFGRLQLATSADSTRLAGLVVSLDDKVDRLEEAFEDFEEDIRQGRAALTAGGGDTGDAGDDAQLRERLDRVEDKLDRVLAALAARDGDGTSVEEAAR